MEDSVYVLRGFFWLESLLLLPVELLCFVLVLWARSQWMALLIEFFVDYLPIDASSVVFLVAERFGEELDKL